MVGILIKLKQVEKKKLLWEMCQKDIIEKKGTDKGYGEIRH